MICSLALNAPALWQVRADRPRLDKLTDMARAIHAEADATLNTSDIDNQVPAPAPAQ